MSRIYAVQALPAKDWEWVDRLIRSHRYVNLKAVHAAVAERGLPVSRTALWRYMQHLQKTDALRQPDAGNVLVVLVDRASGETKSILTTYTMAEALARVA